MFYSVFGMLAIVLHIIINFNIIRTGNKGNKGESDGVNLRYRLFLYALLVFYIADSFWGVLVESKIRLLAYSDTFLFFSSMAVSVLLWTQYVAAFIGKKRLRASLFLAGGYVIFAFVILTLIFNFFNPIVFTFKEDCTYMPGPARYIILGIQFIHFLLIAVYAFVTAFLSSERDRVHYFAVGFSGGMMTAFIALQMTDPFIPAYSVGCLIANCVIHIFVEEDEKMEQHRKVLDAQEEKERYSLIAEGLASNYDAIYYVNAETGEYVGYTASNIFGDQKIEDAGDDFFGDVKNNISLVIHPKDREFMFSILDRDYLLSTLEERKQFHHQYRLLTNGQVQYTRLMARKTRDGKHIIVGVENIDSEVKKEREHLQALNTEKELARRDEMTGIRNKTAFVELQQSIQNRLSGGLEENPFAIAVCDLNDLKIINDTKGHKAGDDYIKSAVKVLCEIFDHSPVFRIGGDEFAIFLSGRDYDDKESLIEKVHKISEENRDQKSGPVIAIGCADYFPSEKKNFDEIFEQADYQMYDDKRRLKNG